VKPKLLITGLLLAFVATSLVYTGWREMRPVTASAAQQSSSSATDILTAPIGVVYFHGSVRCPTCISIEEGARSAIKSHYAQALEAGTIAWHEVNYDTPADAHFRKDFELAFQSLVLIDQRDGKIRRWENIPEVWTRVHEGPDAFAAFLVERLDSFVADSAP
jgi:hypothetical protein